MFATAKLLKISPATQASERRSQCWKEQVHLPALELFWICLLFTGISVLAFNHIHPYTHPSGPSWTRLTSLSILFMSCHKSTSLCSLVAWAAHPYCNPYKSNLPSTLRGIVNEYPLSG